jgi:hypothetical protein
MSARIERLFIVACALGSAAMNLAAADTSSPRSVIAYMGPPIFLAAVIVEDVHTVVLATGGLDLLAAKLLHGTRCACDFWAEGLGISSDDFAVPAS